MYLLVKYERVVKHEPPYIDVVPDEVILTVNWLNYLNYEANPHSSSTRH